MPSLKKAKPLFMFLFIVIISPLISSGCSKELPSKSSFNRNPIYSEKDLLIHYIDVGQGDSILIQINNKNLLIDGGPTESSEKVIKYLKSQNVKKLDFVIATHPHEDHIGGLSKVLQSFKTAQIYAPKKSASSETFDDFIGEIKDKNLKINIAKTGVSLDMGNEVFVNMLSPIETEYEDINNYSVVIKLTYGSAKFLFMGDAEMLVENQLIGNKYDLSADVLKIGHHGSNSSTSKVFLQKVSPKYAVISCGKGNDYGHPHKETVENLKSMEVNTFRTDIDKDILLKSDGYNIAKVY